MVLRFWQENKIMIFSSFGEKTKFQDLRFYDFGRKIQYYDFCSFGGNTYFPDFTVLAERQYYIILRIFQKKLFFTFIINS